MNSSPNSSAKSPQSSKDFVLTDDMEEDNGELNRTIQEFDIFLQQIRDEMREPTLAEKIGEVLKKHKVNVSAGDKQGLLREIKTALDTIQLLHISFNGEV